MSVTVAATIDGAYAVVRWEEYGETATTLVNVFLAAAQGLGFAEASMLDAMWGAIEERDPDRYYGNGEGGPVHEVRKGDDDEVL